MRQLRPRLSIPKETARRGVHSYRFTAPDLCVRPFLRKTGQTICQLI